MAAHDASTSGMVGERAQISGSFTPCHDLPSEFVQTPYAVRWASAAKDHDANGATETACLCHGAGARGTIPKGGGGGRSGNEVVVEKVLVVVVVVVVVVLARMLGRVPTLRSCTAREWDDIWLPVGNGTNAIPALAASLFTCRRSFRVVRYVLGTNPGIGALPTPFAMHSFMRYSTAICRSRRALALLFLKT